MVMILDSLGGQNNVLNNGKTSQYLVDLKKKELFIKIKVKISGLKLVPQFGSIKACYRICNELKHDI